MEAADLDEAPFLAGRFRVERLLKRGQGVDTWLAVDEEDGRRPVVMKTVAAAGVNPSTRARLEHEAQVLARLGTDSFRPLVAWGRRGDALFLVQPFVEGITLQERLAPGALSTPSALRLGIDVLSELAMAHAQGVLHRDVKPTNVMVDGDEPVRHAVLIDFGLAKSAGLDPSVRDEPVGTARYLAPEASGLLDVVADERADLYSFGVLLFECLAGRPPFQATTVGEVLRQHLTTPAPLLRSLGVRVPRALDEVVSRLLRKDPGQRYQSAAAVLADLEKIDAALAAGTADPQVTAGLHDRRIALTEAAFVGRTPELAALISHLADAGRGNGGLVLVEAESGGGKTRLLDELALEVGPGAWTLRGQVVDQAAQRPFQLLDGVAATILAAAADDPAKVDRLKSRLDDRTEAVVAALPVLGAALGRSEREELGPEAYGEVRSIEALRALVDGLGEPGRPALVLLDDCQWSDGLTARLLARWNERSDGACHVLVVAAFRSEEVGPGHALRGLRPRATITLGPFDPPAVGLLCTSMAGVLPAEALEVVVRLAEGSPFMASAVLRGMVESGALYWADDGSGDASAAEGPTPARFTGGWRIDPGAMAVVQTSRRAALFLVRRLERCRPRCSSSSAWEPSLARSSIWAWPRSCPVARRPTPRWSCRRLGVDASSGSTRRRGDAASVTTSCARPFWTGFRPPSAATFTGERHSGSKRRIRTGSSSWPTTTTPVATGHTRSTTPCERPRRPVPNTPWRWRPPTTGSPSAGHRRATQRRERASPRAMATFSYSRVRTQRPPPAWRTRWPSPPPGWPRWRLRESSVTWRSSGVTPLAPATGWRGHYVTWAGGPLVSPPPSWWPCSGRSSYRRCTPSHPGSVTDAGPRTARRTSSPSASTAGWPTCTGSTAEKSPAGGPTCGR